MATPACHAAFAVSLPLSMLMLFRRHAAFCHAAAAAAAMLLFDTRFTYMPRQH